MFNESNVDNRLRRSVRGRVIVFTTSKIVEFLTKELTQTFPLYNFPNVPAGKAAAFVIEADGFLTFDEGSYVKISDELGPFVQFTYQPTEFAILEAAEPFVRTVIEVKPFHVYDNYSTEIEDYIKVADQISVVYFRAPGEPVRDIYTLKPKELPFDEVAALCAQYFKVGAEYTAGEGAQRFPDKLTYVGIGN